MLRRPLLLLEPMHTQALSSCVRLFLFGSVNEDAAHLCFVQQLHAAYMRFFFFERTQRIYVAGRPQRSSIIGP